MTRNAAASPDADGNAGRDSRETTKAAEVHARPDRHVDVFEFPTPGRQSTSASSNATIGTHWIPVQILATLLTGIVLYGAVQWASPRGESFDSYDVPRDRTVVTWEAPLANEPSWSTYPQTDQPLGGWPSMQTGSTGPVATMARLDGHIEPIKRQ